MKKIVSILMIATAMLAVGCYDSFDEPKPAHVYSDADFADKELVTIAELKDRFEAEEGVGAAQIGKSWTVEEDLVIRGRVISSDKTGNVYKSLYLYDESCQEAIELRLHAGNNVVYGPGCTVYVLVKGLTMGNYRTMVSIGVRSRNADYANGNIEDMYLVGQHIKKGETVPLTAADTLVINSGNYNSLTDADLGRLVRFEGVKSKWGVAGWGYKNAFPNYFANQTSVPWEDFYGSEESPTGRVNPTWACSIMDENKATTYYFGSAWFTYDDQSATLPGQYVVRTSGYAQYKWEEIPADGATVDITAIYTKFTNASGADFSAAYQLLLNGSEDVVVRP